MKKIYLNEEENMLGDRERRFCDSNGMGISHELDPLERRNISNGRQYEIYNNSSNNILDGGVIVNQRTISQNASIHKYCEIMADKLNDTDKSVQEVVTLPISWSKENFKEIIWKKVQVAMFPEVESTTKLSTTQVTEVYEEVNRLMGQIASVSTEFPSYFNEK
jgi:hypothetical protein